MCSLKVTSSSLNFTTKWELEFVDLTEEIIDFVSKSGVRNGLVHVFAPHATGILILTEDDPALLEDIKKFLSQLIPKGGDYSHPSNAHAHLRSMLLVPDKTLPIIDGEVALGTWQSLLFVETDIYSRKRTIILQAIGEE